MLFCAYAVILVFGLYLNRGDGAMLALTSLVGASVFVPISHNSAIHFYLLCIIAEIIVALCALKLKARAAPRIIEICSALVLAHCMGYILDGYPPLSPYRIIVKMLEIGQLVFCVIMSQPIYFRLRNT